MSALLVWFACFLIGHGWGASFPGIVQFGAVNCDDEKELAGQYGVQGFPTIKVFPAGKKVFLRGFFVLLLLPFVVILAHVMVHVRRLPAWRSRMKAHDRPLRSARLLLTSSPTL